MQKNRFTVAIDLDLTIFDTDQDWLEYLHRNSTDFNLNQYMKDKLNSCVNYDLREYFTLNEGLNGFEFWSHPDTYMNCEIKRFAKDVIRNLYEANIEIVFVSYCMGCSDQIKYKIERLKQEFNFFREGEFHFTATKSKGLVYCDILVDDRNEFLNQMSQDVKLIKMDTHYTQNETLQRDGVDVVSNWKQVENLICNYIEKEKQ